MKQTSCRDSRKIPFTALLSIILVTCISMLGIDLSSRMASAHTLAPGQGDVVLNNCSAPPPAKPDPDSLLVVLLDRSGSLIDQPRATDPNHYSTSVTKALADRRRAKRTCSQMAASMP